MATGVPSVSAMHHKRVEGVSDDVDFEIHGAEMQFVEIELDPGESAVAEAGSMMYKPRDVSMDTVFGDGSGKEGGLGGKLFGAAKRLITGESLFTTVYTHEGAGKARVRRRIAHAVSAELEQRLLESGEAALDGPCQEVMSGTCSVEEAARDWLDKNMR